MTAAQRHLAANGVYKFTARITLAGKRKIEAKALAKLRKHRDAKKLHDYIK